MRRLASLLAVLMLSLLLWRFVIARPGEERAGEAADNVRVPDFVITSYQNASALQGSELRFSSLLGQGKPLVLNFFAGLCPPCRAEMPTFQRVHEQYGDKVTIFGLDVGPFVALGSAEDGRRLVQELGITYLAGTTNDASVVRDYKVAGMPTTFFITPKGRVIRQVTGLITSNQLVANIEELLTTASRQ